MYILKGIRVPHAISESLSYTPMALFTLEDDAKGYIEKSKLSSYLNFCNGKCENQFRKKSLLYGYCDAYVEKQTIDTLPVDPKI